MITDEIRERLFSESDEKFLQFQKRIIPCPDEMIGVRTPVLRQIAREYAKREDIGVFLSDVPHRYFEETNLHGFIISLEKDFDKALEKTEKFLPLVNNWATCDLVSPKVFSRRKAELKPWIKKEMLSDAPYTVRFAVEMAMSHFLGRDYDAELAENISRIRSDEYYVNMMKAWYFATALASNWDEILPFLTQNALDVWSHNMTVRKARESYRITPNRKEYLLTLKRK